MRALRLLSGKRPLAPTPSGTDWKFEDMRILGITGGIATGKSTVTQMFSELGATVVSADQISRDLLAPRSPLIPAVAALFPACLGIPGGDPNAIDRRALARIVFADPEARAQLEEIVHPPIIAELRRRIADLRQVDTQLLAAIEIPLLYEAGLQKLVDRVAVVVCSEETQVQRLRQRLSAGRDEAMRHIRAQWPLARKTALADHVISTDIDYESTRSEVRCVWVAETRS